MSHREPVPFEAGRGLALLIFSPFACIMSPGVFHDTDIDTCMIVLQTKRLTLRHFQRTDDRAIACVFADPEVMRFGDGVKSHEWIQDWLDGCAYDYQKRGWGPFAVIENASGNLIGYCGLLCIPDMNGQPEIEIGYRLARASWGQGYTTEAVLAVRDFAFSSLGLTRLVAMIDPDNIASIRVAEKAGMKYEQDVIFEGYTHPDRVYSISRLGIGV